MASCYKLALVKDTAEKAREAAQWVKYLLTSMRTKVQNPRIYINAKSSGVHL